MRVLLAEDNVRLARATEVILEKNGLAVEVAHDGLEALDLYNRYIARVPRDKEGRVAATLDNFKEFLRGEGFGSFSDDE